MSVDRFDELTKVFAREAPRRGVLKGLAMALGATAVGGALSAISVRQAEAQPGCRNDADCGGCNHCVGGNGNGRNGTCVSGCRRPQICCPATDTCLSVGQCNQATG